jgi:PAS domain S-box-containing protein
LTREREVVVLAPDVGWELPDLWGVLAAASPFGVAVTDAAHRVVWVNQALAGMYGADVSARLGHPLMQAAPELPASLQESLEGVLMTGEPVSDLSVQLTPAVHNPAGNTRSLRCSYLPVRDRGGRPGVVHVVEDVTELRVAEQGSRQRVECGTRSR